MSIVNKLAILGSTGSIGTQALEIARKYKIKITALCANSNIELLEKQVREFSVPMVAVFDEQKAEILKERMKDTDTEIYAGKSGVEFIAANSKGSMLLNAIVGIAGLTPTISAICAGKNIALANKETLVTGGELVYSLAKEHGVSILPVDSEHSAIFQCLIGCSDKNKQLKKIILTASGGPFFQKKRVELSEIKAKDALKHPNWDMGAKITIDSATLMNKGLEVIEACWLFNVSPNDIEVIVHRESVIHSAVEFIDNSVIAQLGVPDMTIPIQFALSYPDRIESNVKQLSLTDYKTLTFYEPDEKTFTPLKICKSAIEIGGTMPAAINGANEALVSLFLKDKIKFTDIFDGILYAFENHTVLSADNLDNILEADAWARKFIFDKYDRG